MSDSYRFRPVVQESESTPPHILGEDKGDMEATLDRWQKTLRLRYPERLHHLVWDHERIVRLEAAVDEVMTLDDDYPRHLAAFFRRSVLNRMTGLGPIDELLTDERVSEIMLNGTHSFCERDGRITEVKLALSDDEEVAELARRLASRAGRELNSENALCDAQLADGSRIHCVLPPVSEWPTLTIRRASRRPLSLEDYIQAGSLSMELWEDLSQMVRERKNIIVAGGAGSGKTSLLRLLATAIDPEERLITIEDVRELNLSHAHTIRLEAYRQYSVRQLLVNALRMRPDRIIVGEVRGEEALDLIDAMATGHPGSLSTVHSAQGGMRPIHRLARMAMPRAQSMSFDALVDQIMDTVDVMIYVVRDAGGQRRVDSVVEVTPDGPKVRWTHSHERTGEHFLPVGL